MTTTTLHSPDAVAPWLADDAFPLAPADQPYGYRTEKKLVPCTFDELEDALRLKPYRAIDLVWTPEHPRLVPPAESALLRAALRQGMRRSVHQRLRLAVIMLLSWGFALFFAATMSNGVQPVLLLYMLVIGLLPFAHHLWVFVQLRRGIEPPIDVAEHRFHAWLTGRPAPATIRLIACLTIVGAVQLVMAWQYLSESQWSTIIVAGLIPPLVWDGAYWRLLTSALLYAHPMHFLLNMAALLVLGKYCEVFIGRAVVPLTFLLAALGGNVLSLLLMPAATVGASGGVLGLLGLLLVFTWRYRTVAPRTVQQVLLILLGLVVVSNLFPPGQINYAAHLGGILTGVGLGLLLFASHAPPDPDAPSPRLHRAGMIAAGVLGLVSLFTILLLLRVVPA
jgi:membrane associated rhomboid family serine protease